jgi:hypothetical protein
MGEVPLSQSNTCTLSTTRVRPCTMLVWGCRGTSLMRKGTCPWDHHIALGIGLLRGPGGAMFPIGEVALYKGYLIQEHAPP